ncbi:MAG: helix-turn-helix domain-containing protein, partial [Acidobacteriota bacterium]
MPWKGNVRELENALTRAVILAKGDVVLEENLPLERGERVLLPKELVPMKEVEKNYIQYVLKSTKGNKTQTSQILQISRPTLDKKIREYDLEI